jgi:hypothetical protein
MNTLILLLAMFGLLVFLWLITSRRVYGYGYRHGWHKNNWNNRGGWGYEGFYGGGFGPSFNGALGMDEANYSEQAKKKN